MNWGTWTKEYRIQRYWQNTNDDIIDNISLIKLVESGYLHMN